MCIMAAPKGNGLAANVNDPMAAGGMAATDVTQAREQAKSREFLTKHRFKEPEDSCHAINMKKVVQRRAEERDAEAKRVLLKKDDKGSLTSAIP